MKLYKIAFRNISRNSRRSLLSGSAIAIAAMIITILLSLYSGIGKDMEDNVFKFLTGHIRIRHNEYTENENLNPLHLSIDNYKEILTRLDGINTIKASNPRISFGTAFYGSPRLFMEDIKNWDKFLNLLKSGDGPVFAFIKEKYLYAKERLSENGTNLPGLDELTSTTNGMVLGDLLYGINEALTRFELYDLSFFSGISLSEETKEYTKGKVSYEERILFNRLLLQDAFPDLIAESPRTGKMILGMGMGLDFERDKDFIDIKDKINKRDARGELPETGKDVREIILTSGLAKKLNSTIGDRLTISTKTKYSGINGMTFKVKGIVNLPVGMYNNNMFFLPIDTAQKLLKMEESVTEILVLLKNKNMIKKTIPVIQDKIAQTNIPNIDVSPWSTIDIYPMYLAVIDFVGYYMGLFFFLLGSTVIITTTMMVIYERMREIGTIAAMGMKSGQIVWLFFLESFFIGVIASFIGVVIGSGITIPLGIFGLDWTEAMGEIDMAISGFLRPQWDLGRTLIVFVYSTAIASFASFIPSRRAAKIQPVEALRAV
ncbi:MAG: FtsX-like permease family protein [Candidatus Pacearchaeota archaeon]|nr:FtsX-like permease family protein [Candidatus Pacearchaeota archaeon]